MRSPLSVLYNFHWVLPGVVARSAQPYFGLYQTHLTANGIKSVVNLRGPQPVLRWWQEETRICRELGIAHFDLTLNSRELPPRANLQRLFEIFDAAPQPVMIKCSGGQDRTSFACSLYIVHHKGWSALAEAQAQFSAWPYLHVPKPNQRWLRHFLRYAQEQAEGAQLSDWVRTRYDPHRLADWLNANGLADSYEGFLDMSRFKA